MQWNLKQTRIKFYSMSNVAKMALRNSARMTQRVVGILAVSISANQF